MSSEIMRDYFKPILNVITKDFNNKFIGKEFLVHCS